MEINAHNNTNNEMRTNESEIKEQTETKVNVIM